MKKEKIMNCYLDGLCDQIDASMFSGDEFLYEENRKGLKEYIGRWQREMERIESLPPEEDDK
jgi:ADP-dependent phosphofructokinase/glucokinase